MLSFILGAGSGSGSGGTKDHTKLANRDLADQHPISAITGLSEALANRPQGISFPNIASLVSTLNSASLSTYAIGQPFYLRQVTTPDYWVALKETTSVTYTYTSDAAFIEAVQSAGANGLQIGYCRICELESNLSTKQDKLVSGTNIKTVNGNSILGSGNLDVTPPSATYNTAGLIKLGSDTSASQAVQQVTSVANRQYAIQTNGDGRASVNVPWTDTTYENLPAAQGGTDVSLVTTGEKYVWNNKQDALPTVANDMYLHTNAVTGTLEWVEAASSADMQALWSNGGTYAEILNEEF